MKILAALAALLLTTAALAATPGKSAGAAAPASGEKTAVIKVKGMTCGGCVAHVDEAVGKLKGVKSVHTDLDKERTTVVFDAAQVKPQQLAAAISEAGYKPGKPQVK